MNKKNLRFFFDYGCCFWGNDGGIDYNNLPISKELISELDILMEEYATQINWDCPLSSVPWTEEHETDFKSRANATYEKLKNELSKDFEIENEINKNIDDN